MIRCALKTAALSWLLGIGLVAAQPESQPAKQAFPMVIEGTPCQITAYQPTSPLIFAPMVEKDCRPDSEWLLAIMLTNSDISNLLSDEEIAKFFEPKLEAAKIQQLRAATKEMAAMTGPAAPDNPWKGMKHAVDCLFVIDSDRGKFLLYQLSSVGGQVNGHIHGALRRISGRWVQAGDEKAAANDFKISNLALIPKEFAKRKESGGLQALPIEDLLK